MPILGRDGRVVWVQGAALVEAAKVGVVRKEEQPLWHWAETIGDTGSAAGVARTSLADEAFRKGFAPGDRVLGLTSSGSGDRSAAGRRDAAVMKGARATEGDAVGARFTRTVTRSPARPATARYRVLPGRLPKPAVAAAGPIPVPYPDTSFSKDMQKGSKTVMIKNKEVMLKDQSFYKTSPLGDEAATRASGGRASPTSSPARRTSWPGRWMSSSREQTSIATRT